jgi:hypothetical protein
MELGPILGGRPPEIKPLLEALQGTPFAGLVSLVSTDELLEVLSKQAADRGSPSGGKHLRFPHKIGVDL